MGGEISYFNGSVTKKIDKFSVVYRLWLFEKQFKRKYAKGH